MGRLPAFGAVGAAKGLGGETSCWKNTEIDVFFLITLL